MDYATLAGDMLLAIATSLSGHTARVARRNKKTVDDIKHKVDAITIPDLDRRIREVVIEQLAEGEGERIRTLMRSLMNRRGIHYDE